MIGPSAKRALVGSFGTRDPVLRRVCPTQQHRVLERMRQQEPRVAIVQRQYSLSTTSLASSDTSTASESNYYRPPPVKHASKFKGPIVNQLWDLRQKAKEKASSSDSPIDMVRPRPPGESMTKIGYDFEDDEFLMERYRNPFGHLRFGKVLEDLDALAGNIAFSHVQDPDINIVTASVDRIRLSGTVGLDKSQQLSGKVNFVGTSSMEIRMQCTGENEDDPWMEG